MRRRDALSLLATATLGTLGASACAGPDFEVVAAEPRHVAVEPRADPPLALGENRPAEAAIDERCRIDALLPSRCEPIHVATVSTTGGTDGRAVADLDSCTAWNAGGFAPHSATLDLAKHQPLDGLMLVPEMTPETAEVVHYVEISEDGRTFSRVGQFRAELTSGRPEVLPLPRGLATRFVRVTTIESPSWVGFREIVPMRCR